MTVVTLRQILFRLTMSIYSTDEQDKTSASLSIVVGAVMRILDQQIKAVSQQTDPSKLDAAKRQLALLEDKRNQVISEVFSEFLAGLTLENTLLQKQYKKEITEIFANEHFFSLNERTLRKWQ